MFLARISRVYVNMYSYILRVGLVAHEQNKLCFCATWAEHDLVLRRPWPAPKFFIRKQDKSSGGSVDTTKTSSGPQRVRMSKGREANRRLQRQTIRYRGLVPTPPPPDQSDHRGGKTKFAIGKAWLGHFWYANLWVPDPPPLSLLPLSTALPARDGPKGCRAAPDTRFAVFRPHRCHGCIAVGVWPPPRTAPRGMSHTRARRCRC